MAMIRAFQRLVFIAGATGLTVLAFHPYHDGALRYGLPLSLAAVWCAGLLSRGRKGLRCVLLVLPVLCAIPFCLPEKPLDTRDLNRRYVAAMERMRGAPYRWGGESRGGIDCSGLPRRALRDALLEIGWRTGNGAAFRAWAEQWWFDTSAKALAENYRGFTRPLGVSGKLRDLDTVHLSPGDLAVTADGRHVMVLLAGGRWIQADPGPLKVVIERPAVDRNPWFDSFVTVHRWMILE
ncbi:MAG: NlpC/P60 family protein [Verrucomicrobiota bacterium]